MKRRASLLTLLAGAAVLGSTVFRAPVARAAQEVTAIIAGPLDAAGNLRVHEMETATVTGTVGATQSGSWVVQVNNSTTAPVNVFDVSPLRRQVVNIRLADEGAYLVPVSAQFLVIEFVSGQCGTSPSTAHVVAFELANEVYPAQGTQFWSHYFPLTDNGVSYDTRYQAAAQQLRVVAAPGTFVRFSAAADSTATSLNCVATISGYLQNLP